MAKILVAFFNCMNDPENPNAMPIYQRIGSGWKSGRCIFTWHVWNGFLGDRSNDKSLHSATGSGHLLYF